MSPEYRNWKVLPKELQIDIKDFIEEHNFDRDFLIQNGFYLLRNPQTQCFTKLVVSPGSSEEINENQKKQALKQNSDWLLIHGIRDCSKIDKKNICLKSGEKRNDKKKYRGKHRSHTKGIYALLHSSEVKCR